MQTVWPQCRYPSTNGCAHVLSFGSDFLEIQRGNEFSISIKTQILESQPLKPKMKFK